MWKKLGRPDVNIIYLDNCGIDDEEFSSLLQGFYYLHQIKLLFYKDNIFGAESLNSIKPLLLKRYPKNLLKLKLVKIKTSPAIVVDLLRFLTDEATSLSSLSLVQMNIPSTTMP